MLSSRTNCADHLVLVGRDLGPEDAQGRIAVAFGDVAEDLVVGPVLLDDVDDVLEDGRLADPFRDGSRRLVRPGRLPGLLQQRIAVVVQHLARQGRQFLGPGDGHQRQAAVVLMGIGFLGPGLL